MDSDLHVPTPGFLVWRLSMKWRAAVDRALAPLGLTHAQYSLLGSLLEMQQAGLRPSQRELADYTGLEPLYVSKLARALEAGNLIDRARDPDDTRAVRLSLTDPGRAITVHAILIVRRLMDVLLDPLGTARTEEFVRALETLLDPPPKD